MSFARGLRRRLDLHHHLKMVAHGDILGAALKQADMPADASNSDLLPLIGGVGNQGQAGACAGYTTMRDVFGLAVAGQTGQPALFSGLAGYTLGRLLENKLDGLPATTPLQDNGSDPAVDILALQTFAAVLEAEWPMDMGKVNDVGVATVAEAARASSRLPWTVGVYGQIVGVSGTDLLNAICQALLPFPDGKHGRAVTIDVDASTDGFQGATGSSVLDPVGAKELDHSVSLIDYRTNAAARREYRLLNHWGTADWAAQCDIPGTVWVSEDFVLASLGMGSLFHFIQAEART